MKVDIIGKPLIRDTNSMALLSTDKVGLQNYMVQRDIAKKRLEEEYQLKEKVNALESDIKDIKNLLQELVNNK